MEGPSLSPPKMLFNDNGYMSGEIGDMLNDMILTLIKCNHIISDQLRVEHNILPSTIEDLELTVEALTENCHYRYE